MVVIVLDGEWCSELYIGVNTHKHVMGFKLHYNTMTPSTLVHCCHRNLTDYKPQHRTSMASKSEFFLDVCVGEWLCLKVHLAYWETDSLNKHCCLKVHLAYRETDSLNKH